MRHASRKTHAPILSMSRKSSATGMKANGGISVPSFLGQAYQRLETDEAAVRHFEERLIVQFEAIMQHRIADGPLELESRLQLGVHLRQEEPDAIAAVGLGLVQRQIGTFQQPFGSLPSAGASAMPTLAVVTISCSLNCIGAATARR